MHATPGAFSRCKWGQLCRALWHLLTIAQRKIFTLLTHRLTRGHHSVLSGASRATMERFRRETDGDAGGGGGEKRGRRVTLTGFSMDQRSAKYTQYAPCTYPMRHSEEERAREREGRKERLAPSRISKRPKHKPRAALRTICPTTYSALPSPLPPCRSTTACSALLEETQSQPGVILMNPKYYKTYLEER